MPKTTYMWDELSDNVAAEYEDGVHSVAYTHEPGLYGDLLSQNRNGVTSYYHYDGRGDTVALTEDSGNVTDTKEYDAWGNVIASTGSTVTPYQFLGRLGYQTAVAPLSYVRQRIYQSSIARWLSTDTFDVAESYKYSWCSPVDLTDPSGLRCDIPFKCNKVVFQNDTQCQFECEAEPYWLKPGVSNPKWITRIGGDADCFAVWQWAQKNKRNPLKAYQLKDKVKDTSTGLLGFWCTLKCPDGFEMVLGVQGVGGNPKDDPLWRCSQQDCLAACEDAKKAKEFCGLFYPPIDKICKSAMFLGLQQCKGWCESVCDPFKK
jgi:RHS repeat-associated protein